MHHVSLSLFPEQMGRGRAVWCRCPSLAPKRNFLLCGLPPKDLWEDVTDAWRRAGLNIVDCWKRACSVTNEWVYDHQPDKPLKSRVQQRLITERGIPLKNRTLGETLDPQPQASVVFKRLLDRGVGGNYGSFESRGDVCICIYLFL